MLGASMTKLTLAEHIQSMFEGALFDAYSNATTSNVAPADAEPFTYEKLKQAIADLPPAPRDPLRDFMRFTPFEPAPIAPDDWSDHMRLSTMYGMQVMKPRSVIVWDISEPEWKIEKWTRVACMARGGRKMRHKTWRRVRL